MIQKEIKKGVNLYMINDSKFKTFSVSCLIHRPLSKEEVTLNTLLASTVRMQSGNYPTFAEISRELESLYGATLSSRASKYGERQLIKIGINSVSEKALGKKGNFENAMNLLCDIVLNSGQNGAFSEEIVAVERKNIKDAILAQKNDKRSYSVLRLQEEMCRDEAYGINPMGYINDLERISAKELYSHYKKVIDESRIDIIFAGNFNEDDAVKAAEHFARALNPRDGVEVSEEIVKASGEVKSVTDKMDVTQGKLCMGFRCGENTSTQNYPATIVYNSIFGGSAVSKLFNNVREKLSLCYYVGSSIDRLKEIMIVRSGVEFDNFGKAYDEIMAQQELMVTGDFTDEEIEFAKKQLTTAYESNLDSVGAMAEYYTMQILLGTDVSIEEMVKRIENVKKEEIVQAAKTMVLDTVYYIDKE